MPGSWLEVHHLPSGAWLPRLRRAVTHTPSEGCRSDTREAEEGHKGAGREGRQRQLLAVAEEEGQELGKEYLTPTTTAGVNFYQLQGVTGRRSRD